MDDVFGKEPATSMLAGTGELVHDFELAHILAVASSYLDMGQVDAAEDLLQEALEAAPDHPEVQALTCRIAHVRGVPEVFTDLIEVSPIPVPDILLHFTAPLPGIETRSPGAQRLARAADRHVAEGKVFSAFDLTLILCSEEADFLPGFARMAELQMAHGDPAQARALYQSLARIYELDEQPQPAIVRSLGVALDPADVAALLDYANELIADGDRGALEPFVPEAIERAWTVAPADALELAKAYFETCPDSQLAQELYVQSAADDPARLVEIVRQVSEHGTNLSILLMHVAAETVAGDASWTDPLEQVVNRLWSDPALLDEALSSFDRAPVDLDQPRAVLTRALMFGAVGRWSECLDEVSKIDQSTVESPIDDFIRAFCLALAMEQTGAPGASPALIAAVQAAYHPDVEPFAAATTIFGFSAKPSEILQSLSSSSNTQVAVDALVLLKATHPERLDICYALGEAYIANGDIYEGLRELRFAADSFEKAGNLFDMVKTMRAISRAVPTNPQIKAKLIDGYLRRGILDEAINEMESIGELYVRRGNTSDAVTTFTRAAEIAVTIGQFDRGNEMFSRALEADAESLEVRHAAVAFYLQTGSIEKATEQLWEVVRIALGHGDRDEAVAALHQTIALSPQDPAAYHKLGEVLTSLGEYGQAERVYRRLATFTPHDPVLEAKQSALSALAATG